MEILFDGLPVALTRTQEVPILKRQIRAVHPRCLLKHENVRVHVKSEVLSAAG
jgi:hypothetical protein